MVPRKDHQGSKLPTKIKQLPVDKIRLLSLSTEQWTGESVLLLWRKYLKGALSTTIHTARNYTSGLSSLFLGESSSEWTLLRPNAKSRRSLYASLFLSGWCVQRPWLKSISKSCSSLTTASYVQFNVLLWFYYLQVLTF